MWKRDQSVTPPGPRRAQSAEPAPVESRPPAKLVMDLGKSLVIKGELSGSEDLTLFGQMEGSVSLRCALDAHAGSPYGSYGVLGRALSCFLCSSCFCFFTCCCLPFSLSFLPPL